MLKKSASATDRGAEAQDVRERRDVGRLDFHLVSPVPPVSRPVVPELQANDVLLYEMVVLNRAREKIVAGYCEALPILVQQRPCAYMMLTVGVHFS